MNLQTFANDPWFDPIIDDKIKKKGLVEFTKWRDNE
jgi:hypothetical protein